MGGKYSMRGNFLVNRLKNSTIRSLLSLLSLLTLFLFSCGGDSKSNFVTPIEEIIPSGLSAFSALNDDFPCDAYLDLVNLSPYPVMPVLYGTFGTNFACVAKFTYLNRNRRHVVELHFSNEACRRNRRCFEGELHGNMTVEAFNSLIARNPETSEVRERAEHIQKKIGALANQNTEVILSTGLEDQYTDEAFRSLNGYLQRKFPTYTIIRSPLHGGSFTSAVELHGRVFSCQRGVIASNDGIQLGMSEARGYGTNTRTCGASLFWDCGLQGSCGAFSRPNTRRFLISRETALVWKEFLGGLYGMAF